MGLRSSLETVFIQQTFFTTMKNLIKNFTLVLLVISAACSAADQITDPPMKGTVKTRAPVPDAAHPSMVIVVDDATVQSYPEASIDSSDEDVEEKDTSTPNVPDTSLPPVIDAGIDTGIDAGSDTGVDATILDTGIDVVIILDAADDASDAGSDADANGV